jgi:hypothetical protein
LRPDATHALLGSDGIGSVGVIAWHTNELEAYREAKRINTSGGKVKVVPVVNGELTPEHQAEKAKLFADRYHAVIGQ